MEKKKNLFSYDAETNGLWGQAFAIGAIFADSNGKEIKRFVGRCPIEGEINDWVKENVLPQMTDLEEAYGSYRELLEAFCGFFAECRSEGDIETITHMGMVVESKIWRDAHDMGIIGDWDAPYLTTDVCSFVEVGDSVDSYAASHKISVSAEEFLGGTHNPLYDSAVALAVLVDVRKN